jgi:hypothetical protein
MLSPLSFLGDEHLSGILVATCATESCGELLIRLGQVLAICILLVDSICLGAILG